MAEFRKNIILLPASYDGVNNQKGILNIESDTKNVKCTVKCFNLKMTNEDFLFSVVINDKIFKTKVKTNELSSLTYIVPISCKSGDKISCMILSVHQNDYDILLWGSTETTKAWQNTLVQKMQIELEKENSTNNNQNLYSNNIVEDVKEKINSVNKDYVYTDEKCSKTETFSVYDKEQQEIENYIDKIIGLTENNEKETAPILEKENDYQSERFYDRVKNQIYEIFNQNEKDDILQDIIPNGQFCKVKTQDGYYVFGLIFVSNTPKYICYAIPRLNKGEKPNILDGKCEWLPLDSQNENGKGYWISYQDADSGENIQIEVIS